MSEPPAPPPAPPAPAPTEPAGAAEPEAPAPRPQPVAPATLRERLAWYGGAMLLSCVLVTVGMQLWKRDLKAPFYYDLDALLYLPLVKTTIEHGSHWRTERLGAPGEQELYDFPIIDYLHFAFLWGLGRVFSDLLLVYNAYSLLTYPLTVLTAMWVLRWLKLSLPTAALGGLLYAFLPYHQERYHYHYFLAAYWWVPVSLVPALAITKGDFPFFRRGPDGRYPPLTIDWRGVWATVRGAVRGSVSAWKAALGWGTRATVTAFRALFTWRSLGYIALGAVTASAGAYYAFFACATYAFAGAYAWAIHRTWRAAASAVLVIAPVVAVGYVYHIPTFRYHARYQSNAITSRYPHEADSYGLKVAHLLLPANDHNFRPFATLRTMYSTPDRPAEGESAGSLGVIGGAGLLALIVLAFLPRKRQWPEGTLSALVLYLVLLGSIGAFGSLFNLLVTAQIRAYNRIGVFIAFPCFFVVLWWLDGFLLTRTGRWARRARYPALGALFLVGYFDQTPWGWNPINPAGMEKIDLFAERFRADKDFFRRVEAAVPAGTKVFCLPYSAFPESPPVHRMAAYEPARGYVMTDTLYWSFGAIKGREADMWNREVAFSKPDEMLPRVVARGFDGLFVDGRGFAASKEVDKAAALINRINELYRQLAGVPPTARLPEVVHDDGRQFFIDLRPYREAYRRTDPAGYAARAKAEAEWVAPLWLGGFHVSTPTDESGESLQWGPFDADLVLVNPTDRTRAFEMSFLIGVDTVGPFDITIGGPINDALVLGSGTSSQGQKGHGERKAYAVALAPGRTVIHFRCRPPEYFLPFDRRNLCYHIKDFKLREMAPSK
ncbi:MAG: hypothetical protein J0I06_19720 [Planctomycetes bacterium]|nr:hypothetical protein [Planctomycetota bacterium]